MAASGTLRNRVNSTCTLTYNSGFIKYEANRVHFIYSGITPHVLQ